MSTCKCDVNDLHCSYFDEALVKLCVEVEKSPVHSHAYSIVCGIVQVLACAGGGTRSARRQVCHSLGRDTALACTNRAVTPHAHVFIASADLGRFNFISSGKTKMDCACCKRSMKGCASIKCSLCASQFHLECVSSEHLLSTRNSWRCSNCERALLDAAMTPKVGETVVLG